MARYTLVLVAAVLINTLSYCSAKNVYVSHPLPLHAHPALTTPTVPHPLCHTHCATLSEYAWETELYFTSNTTMVFFSGDHVLDMNITVANVEGLTMCGESSSDNSCLWWVSWPQFHKCDGVQNRYTFFDFCLLWQKICTYFSTCCLCDPAFAILPLHAGNNFTQNRASASSFGGAILAYTILYLASVGLTTSSATQQTVVVELSMQCTIYCT